MSSAPRPTTVVWNAFNGRYADNPRALHEGLLARGLDEGAGWHHVWMADPRHTSAFPEGVRTVPVRSAACAEALAAADVVVANCHVTLDPWPAGRPEGEPRFLQTWHGTPLKRIHRSAASLPSEAVLAELDADIARWDALVTPSPEATRLLREAFAYDGEVLETGYPRNDVLSAPDAGERRAAVRSQLGIPEGATAVLLAPTYRDDEANGSGDLPLGFDVPELLDALGDDVVLVLRLHYYVADRLTLSRDPRVVDASNHPDVAELYLAADALVTDYSSSMFDFAVTGRPVVLYAYDLDRYRDVLRGFTFDLRGEGPGPLLTRPHELAEALGDLPGVASAFQGQYAAFRERWCSLEDGRATDRVLDAFFGPAS
ncbi:CDP-glycerol glycerophosphotransferase family protein [Quadrisphaera setariae]|uniref:CDP-glycerol glycerophosphotransferase family protein n=1 Tax=Quadrisphaera setariae TaxID=2593304 RepID=A0A5C8ZL56_9ACTN|nr:CDP-glycerol glycerophosphotransferase family protein [Quadrisphaera setariae]TXR57901.1 CDP-glycerol glycerophosphotransferase family protein [Quadrisphaera setariae]